jgi:2-haloalkanoic acid dehalogenase type II
MTFENKTFLTFDCYGTLIDWEGGITNAVKKLADQYGLTLDLDTVPNRYIAVELAVEAEQFRKYREVLAISAQRLLQQEGIAISDAEASEFADSIYTWSPFPETREVLSRLIDRGYRLVILSNVDNPIIRESIKAIGIEFDGVVTAEDVGSYKPSHGHWEEMLRRFGAQKEQVLHVAASYVHDIVPARELGFDAIWINRNTEKPTGTVTPNAELRDLSALPGLLS